MGQTLQQIIQAMLDKVTAMVNTEGNPYYLPTWIKNNHYDPFGQGDTISWSVSIDDPSVVQLASSVCPTLDEVTTLCAGASSGIGAPGTVPTLVLGRDSPGGMIVSGGSNAYVASLTADLGNPYLITGFGSISSLHNQNLPQNLTVSGDFKFTQYCCCSLDGKTCTTAPAPVVGTGTFNAKVNGSPQIRINFQITELAQDKLTISVTSMVFTPPMNPNTQAPDITVTVDITNIPEGANRQSYNNMAQAAFNSRPALDHVNQQINAVMNDPSQLSFIGGLLTQVIDGYLRDNHQYPFGPPGLALR